MTYSEPSLHNSPRNKAISIVNNLEDFFLQFGFTEDEYSLIDNISYLDEIFKRDKNKYPSGYYVINLEFKFTQTIQFPLFINALAGYIKYILGKNIPHFIVEIKRDEKRAKYFTCGEIIITIPVNGGKES